MPLKIENLAMSFKEKYNNSTYQINQSAGIILFDDNFCYLLLNKKRKWEKKDAFSYEIKYSAIGGAIENNETPIQCLAREIKEEITSTISDIDIKSFRITYIIDKDSNILEKSFPDAIPAPLCIFERELPLRKDVIFKKNNWEKSCLQLFLYIGYISKPFRINEDEIPAIIKVPKTDLINFINKRQSFVQNSFLNKFILDINANFVNKYGEIPEKIILSPQFSFTAFKILFDNKKIFAF
ncbi:MAG: NUDIX domain-containing protein [Endomicrobia bacterium]|nr:NUDIX domain-containing protein [Endomicrobiia bacterium]